MEKIHCYSFILMLLISINLFSQEINTPHELGRTAFSGNRIKELPPKVGGLEGSIYMNDNWEEFNITLLSNEVIKGIICKYDIEHNSFDIKYNDQVKVLSGNLIKKFTRVSLRANSKTTRTFRNVRTFKNKNSYKTGFVEELFLGKKYQVYKRHYIKHIMPTYNAALDIGEKAEQLVKANEIVILSNGSFEKLETNKKKNVKFFNDKNIDILSYMKANKLSYKEERDVKMIFAHYEVLLSNTM